MKKSLLSRPNRGAPFSRSAHQDGRPRRGQRRRRHEPLARLDSGQGRREFLRGHPPGGSGAGGTDDDDLRRAAARGCSVPSRPERAEDNDETMAAGFHGMEETLATPIRLAGRVSGLTDVGGGSSGVHAGDLRFSRRIPARHRGTI